MDKIERKKILWLFRQPEDIILDAIRLQRDLYFKFRSENKAADPNSLTLIAFIKAAERFHETEHPTTHKSPEHDLEPLRKKVIDRIKRHKTRHNEKIKESKKKESKKKNRIKELMYEIKIMRGQGQSFSAIADYIKKYHRLVLHPTYISKIFHELEETK